MRLSTHSIWGRLREWLEDPLEAKLAEVTKERDDSKRTCDAYHERWLVTEDRAIREISRRIRWKGLAKWMREQLADVAVERDDLRSALDAEIARSDALVASLPKCDQCDRPATRSPGRGRERRCDDHRMVSRAPGEQFTAPDYPRAEPLRAIERARKNPK